MIICALHEGGKVQIADQTVTLKSVSRPGAVVLSLQSGEDVVVVWDRFVELFPTVMVGVDRNGSHGERAKILIKAPRDILVKRVADAGA